VVVPNETEEPQYTVDRSRHKSGGTAWEETKATLYGGRESTSV
jgi:hypothetical protein